MKTFKLTLSALITLLLLSACDSSEKIANRIVNAAADLKVERLQSLDTLIAAHGDSTECLTVEALPVFSFESLEEQSDTFRTVYKAIETLLENYDHTDTLPCDSLKFPTLIWFKNNSAYHVRGFYDKDFKLLMKPAFKHVLFKDAQQLQAYIDKSSSDLSYYIPEKQCIDYIKLLKRARYLTIVETKYEMKPYSSFTMFSFGGILADVVVYDLETGAEYKKMSIFASNSRSVTSRTHNGITDADNALDADLVFHFRRNLVRELNKLCDENTVPSKSLSPNEPSKK